MPTPPQILTVSTREKARDNVIRCTLAALMGAFLLFFFYLIGAPDATAVGVLSYVFAVLVFLPLVLAPLGEIVIWVEHRINHEGATSAICCRLFHLPYRRVQREEVGAVGVHIGRSVRVHPPPCFVVLHRAHGGKSKLYVGRSVRKADRVCRDVAALLDVPLRA